MRAFSVSVIALLALAGVACASTPHLDCPPTQIQVIHCEALPKYSDSADAEAQEELADVPERTALYIMVKDYLKLRATMKAACTAT